MPCLRERLLAVYFLTGHVVKSSLQTCPPEGWRGCYHLGSCQRKHGRGGERGIKQIMASVMNSITHFRANDRSAIYKQTEDRWQLWQLYGSQPRKQPYRESFSKFITMFHYGEEENAADVEVFKGSWRHDIISRENFNDNIPVMGNDGYAGQLV